MVSIAIHSAVNQSVSQPTDRSTDRSINQSICFTSIHLNGPLGSSGASEFKNEYYA